MVASSPRILLCGDVLGRLNQLFKRVQSVNKSTGPFDALLCVGQFFPDTDDNLEEVASYLDGWSPIPISTYFIGDYGAGATRFLSAAAKMPSNKGFKMDGLEVCPNLYWLKGSGKFSFHGLSIFYLSGRRIPDAEGNGRYTADDVDALRALVEEPGVVDIFMTNEWPSGVWNRTDLSEAALGVSDPSGSDPVVAELAAQIKPRYHIAGTKAVFYAREPYSNDDAVHVTRFLGLATVGNKEKQKFIHAISPTPASAMPASEIHLKPPNTTVSPYAIEGTTNHLREQAKRPANSDSANQYWRFDVSKKRPRHDALSGERLCFKYTSSGACAQGKKCSYRHDEDAREQYLRNVCFDFLNKGRCERVPDCRFRHSLVEEGDILSQGGQGSQNGKSYRTIPEKKCWFCLSSPDAEVHLVLSIGESYYCALAKGPLVEDHALLIPIEHHPNTLTTTSESEVELGKYKDALKVYFKNQEKTVVFFEWIFRSSPHANIQAVPIPLSKASNIQRIFNFAAKKLGFEFSVVAPRVISSGCGTHKNLKTAILYKHKASIPAVPIPLSKASNIQRIFNFAAKKLGFEFSVVAPSGDHSEARISLRSKFDGKSNLFYVELPNGNILSYSVTEKEKLPVQFGREVLAGLLNMADRADWRNCKLSKEDELQMVEKFKKGFKELDPAA